MLHPDTELRKVSDAVGYGVFAVRPIPRGTITWVLDPLDQILDPSGTGNIEGPLGDVLKRYTWLNCHGERILCWDFGRFMNHACEPGSLSPGGFDFEIAIRDVGAGEELTCDYGSLNLEEPLCCECGSRRCRRIVAASDFEWLAPTWDRQLREAFPEVGKVAQPLSPWIDGYSEVLEILTTRPETIPSILAHRWTSLPADGPADHRILAKHDEKNLQSGSKRRPTRRAPDTCAAGSIG